MLGQRQESIFEKVIKEYLKTAKPVGSGFLVEKYDFGLSSATVRGIFAELEEEGFLTKPHTSGGRVPTDKGWRFYVDKMLSAYNLPEKEKSRVKKSLNKRKRAELWPEIYSEASKILADLSGNVGIGGDINFPLFFTSGVRDLFFEPEFERPEDFRTLAALFDDLDDYFSIMGKKMKPQIRVFIGEENDFSPAHPYSVIACEHEREGHREIVAILGPKRMDYSRNISLVNFVSELLNE